MSSEAVKEWTTARLDDIAGLTVGPALKGRDFCDATVDSVPLVRGETVGVQSLRWNDEKRWPRNLLDGYRPFLLNQGDIVLAMDGTLSKGNARVARISEGDLPALLVQRVARFRAVEGASQGFLFGLLRSPKFAAYLRSVHTGTTISHVSGGQLKDFEFLCPSLPEQRRIAWVLGTLDDKIELNRKMARTLEETAAAIFNARFVDFDGIEEFEESEIGPIPKGWSAGNVSDLCTKISNGGTPKRKESRFWDQGEIPWFTTSELRDMALPRTSKELISREGLNGSSCKLFPAGTVLIAIYAAPTVGRLGILTSEASFNQACTALEPKSEVGTEFLFFTLRSLRGYFNGISSGSAQQNISKSIVEGAPCVVPPFDEIEPVLEHLRRTLAASQSLAFESSYLASIRDELLPKLISGDIRVPEGVGPNTDADAVVEELVEA